MKTAWALGAALVAAGLIVGCGGSGSPYVPDYSQGAGGGGGGNNGGGGGNGGTLTLTGNETTWFMDCQAVNNLPLTLRTSQGTATVTFDFEGVLPQQVADATPDPATVGTAGTAINLTVTNQAGARSGDGSFTLIARQGTQSTRFTVNYFISPNCTGGGNQ